MTARARSRAVVAALALGLTLAWLLPRAAWALEVPGIDGHMTDPGHVLGHADKTSIEDKLGKIQQDTRIDVAGWIVDAPEGSLDDLGRQAFHKWNIGGEWDNALFFVVPRNGKVHLIQNDAKPALTPAEATRVTNADKPSSPMQQRLDSIADVAGEIVRKKTLQARPAGKSDPARGRLFGAAWLLLTLLAVGLSWRARANRKPKLAA